MHTRLKHARSSWILVVILCHGLAACGSQQSEPELMINEKVLTCKAMLEDFATIDTEKAPESRLVKAMNQASKIADTCEKEFAQEAQSKGENILFVHRSDQLRLFSFFFEAALSRRFDNFAGYCDIMGDIVRVLVKGINTEKKALESGNLSDEDYRKVRELLKLDTQTLEVVSVQIGARCSGP